MVGMDEQSRYAYRVPENMQAGRKSKSSKSSQPRGKSASTSMKSRTPSGPKQKSAAAAYATQQVGQSAKVDATGDSCRVRHREFLGNVTGSVAFAIGNTFAVNPGLQTSFPWLSGIAKNWESYRFRKLRYHFFTRTGTSTPGSVVIAHDPDSSDAAPASEAIMTTYSTCREDAPWKDICLEVPPKSLTELGPRKFVRVAGLGANQDIKLYDSGNLFVGTVDGTAVAWGKMWVEYDIDLFTPQLQPAGSAGGGGISGGGTMSAANPLGTTPTVDPQAVGLSVDNTSKVTLSVAGEYLLSYRVTGTTITALAAPSASSGNSATVFNSAVINAGATIALVQCRVIANALPCVLDFAASPTAATITASTTYFGAAPDGSFI